MHVPDIERARTAVWTWPRKHVALAMFLALWSVLFCGSWFIRHGFQSLFG